MHPILYRFPESWPLLGGLPIRSFSVMVLLGVLAALWWVGRRFKEQGWNEEGAVDRLMWWTLGLGFLGARLTYVAIHPEVYTDPVSLIAIWQGGIVSYGGFFGGALGAFLFARRQGIPFLRLADALAPGLALGQVFGRIGCFLVGDDYGARWNGPWAVRFPAVDGSLIPPELVGVPLHPSQLYLSAMNLLIFGLLVALWRRRRWDGQVAVAAMFLYAVGRFAVEYTRGDAVARGIYGGLSTAQWFGLLTAALAGFVLLRHRRHADAASTGDDAP